MRLGIMQPYFFPNLAHFALIAATDEWVIFDVTQYTPKSWMNRNRILHPDQGWQYVSVPLVKSSIKMMTRDAQVADLNAFHNSLKGKLSHYKKRSPFYRRVLELVDRSFLGASNDTLVALNASCLKETCALLEIPFSYRICSELGFEFPEVMGPGDWAPFIANRLGADSYINPAGGRELFDLAKFEQLGIEIQFAQFTGFDYQTLGYNFEPSLSILDVLMWNDINILKEAILYNNNFIAP